MAQLGSIDPNVAVNNGGGGGGITILGDDDYQLEIIESDVKANSKGTGQNLDFKVQVADGPHKGHWFFAGITSIQHDSAQAQAIGQGQLKALFEAQGGEAAHGFSFDQLSDSEKLHYRPFWARVTSETYYSNKHKKDVTKNVIGKFLWEGMPEESEAKSQPPAGKPTPTQPPAAPARPASGAPARPWAKK